MTKKDLVCYKRPIRSTTQPQREVARSVPESSGTNTREGHEHNAFVMASQIRNGFAGSIRSAACYRNLRINSVCRSDRYKPSTKMVAFPFVE